jgi:hypothetical protein
VLDGPYGLSADIWSVGCVLGECLRGEVLFPAVFPHEMLNVQTEVLGSAPMVSQLAAWGFFIPFFNTSARSLRITFLLLQSNK